MLDSWVLSHSCRAVWLLLSANTALVRLSYQHPCVVSTRSVLLAALLCAGICCSPQAQPTRLQLCSRSMFRVHAGAQWFEHQQACFVTCLQVVCYWFLVQQLHCVESLQCSPASLQLAALTNRCCYVVGCVQVQKGTCPKGDACPLAHGVSTNASTVLLLATSGDTNHDSCAGIAYGSLHWPSLQACIVLPSVMCIVCTGLWCDQLGVLVALGSVATGFD